MTLGQKSVHYNDAKGNLGRMFKISKVAGVTNRN
uniref:Uncharacterized protein n=1 Tax=Rhizophora mucronata TaxID=61149 RepID=A0A2P2PYE9_RHIMU